MLKGKSKRIVACGLVGFAASFCGDLLPAWLQDPFARTGWVSFVFWVGIVCFSTFRKKMDPIQSSLDWFFLIATTALCVMTEFTFLAHVALAIAISGFLPSRFLQGLALLTAASWFPVAGWVGHYLLQVNIDGLRVPILLGFWIGKVAIDYLRSDFRLGSRQLFPR